MKILKLVLLEFLKLYVLNIEVRNASVMNLKLQRVLCISLHHTIYSYQNFTNSKTNSLGLIIC